MDRYRSVSPIGATDDLKCTVLCIEVKALLLVARLQARFLGKHPDLQQTNRLGLGRIELSMPYARPGRHALDFAGLNDRAVAQAIPMFELAGQHVRDDFHVTMRMH